MCLNNDDRIERVKGLVNFTPEPELNEGLGRKHTHRKKKTDGDRNSVRRSFHKRLKCAGKREWRSCKAWVGERGSLTERGMGWKM